MQPSGTPDHSQVEAVKFLVALIRLQRQASDVGRQIDRVETDMQRALSDLARERFEGCR